MKDWKPTKDENPNFTCHVCHSNDVYYRLVEDSDCHEDINYKCGKCGKNWWVDGPDY